MKLIYIANARIPTEKAHGAQIFQMCESFANSKLDVELIIPWRFNHIKQDPFEYYGVKKNFKITKIFSFDLIPLNFGKFGFLIQAFSFAEFATYYVLAKSLFGKIKKTDIIYSRDEISASYLSIFKKNVFWETHTAKKNFIIDLLVQKSKGIIAITQGLKDFYTEKYKINSDKILIGADAVDLEKFDIKISKQEARKKLNLPQDKKIISYIGKYKTMGESKGVEKLIQIFPEILKFNTSAYLLLVGINKDEIDEVDAIFQTLNIKNSQYKIVPHVLQTTVPFYLKASDVLTMNYPNIEHYARYMSPLKLFEYMAGGAPIVSSDLPSIREILNENNSVLVQPD
ncbi:glycosyltransferase, partial [Patescibacteria group bacterium]|nr:glycosyltransferase [Patescibacteria group bacterium]